ncbi:hypothetical protein [Neolewinella aurantiaca]|uniref:hypothetical protein n=1 Tax=Neolewinella aurantiaca TaxID=2602767 RepID=UPI00165091D9|nr:hypothetical protein [Neolewinella aurantiaca]
MKDENNFSTIPSSYKPKDYRLARFAANTGDADLPLPDIAQSDNSDEPETS